MTYQWTPDADKVFRRTFDDHGQDIADTADLELQTVDEPVLLLVLLLLGVIGAGLLVAYLIGPGL